MFFDGVEHSFVRSLFVFLYFFSHHQAIFFKWVFFYCLVPPSSKQNSKETSTVCKIQVNCKYCERALTNILNPRDFLDVKGKNRVRVCLNEREREKESWKCTSTENYKALCFRSRFIVGTVWSDIVLLCQKVWYVSSSHGNWNQCNAILWTNLHFFPSNFYCSFTTSTINSNSSSTNTFQHLCIEIMWGFAVIPPFKLLMKLFEDWCRLKLFEYLTQTCECWL